MPPRKKAKNAAAYKKRTQLRTKAQDADHRGANKGKDGSCPIVGIGGSAGGFEAAMELLRHLPPKTGNGVCDCAPPQFTLQQSIAKGCSAN